MKANNILIGFFSILTAICAITLAAILVVGKDYLHPATGYVLNEEFIRAYTAHDSFSYALLMDIPALVFAGIGMLLALLWNRLTPRPRRAWLMTIDKIFLVAIFALGSVGLYTPVALKIYQQMAYKPHVEAVTLREKYYRNETRESSRNERPYYHFVFSNGSNMEVSEDSYYQYMEDHDFYIIVFRDNCIGYFDADQYSLP